MDDSNFMNDAPSVDIQVQVEPLESTEESDNSPFSGFSRIFSRMSSIIDSLRQQNNGMSSPFNNEHRRSKSFTRRGGCSLLQACGSDIDKVCAYAKRLNIAQAIPKCLMSHRSDLSEECGTYIDRRNGEEQTAEQSEEQTQEGSAEESTKSETEESVEPVTPQQLCRTTANKLCPQIAAHTHNMVSLMSCLYNHRSEVPELCLNHIKDTAAFNCAVDAENLCPGVIHRRDIGRCLKQRSSELSAECKAAAKVAHDKRDASDAPVVSKLVTKLNVDTPSVLTTPPGHTVALILGISGFVVLIAVATMVIVRRRRARQRVRLPVVSTVQLVNPSQLAVSSAAQRFEPRVEDQL